MAAEPIHGCSTTPMGMKTPGQEGDYTQAAAQGGQRGEPSLAAHQKLSSGRLGSPWAGC